MLIDKLVFLEELKAYKTDYPQEHTYLQAIIRFVSDTDRPFSRSTIEGHVTASAWVLSPDKSSVILIHHAKLDKWFQPGGHIESDDISVLLASRRETIEETGVSEMEILRSDVFDIDIHTIPARKEVPEHLHYDVRYCFVASSTHLKADYREVKGIKWIKLENILNSKEIESSLLRMAQKVIDR